MKLLCPLLFLTLHELVLKRHAFKNLLKVFISMPFCIPKTVKGPQNGHIVTSNENAGYGQMTTRSYCVLLFFNISLLNIKSDTF